MQDPFTQLTMSLAASEKARKAATTLASKVAELFAPPDDVRELVNFLKGKTEEMRQEQRLPGIFDVMPRGQKMIADFAIDTLADSTTKGGQATGIELPAGAMAAGWGGKKAAKKLVGAVQEELLDPTIYPKADAVKRLHKDLQNYETVFGDRVGRGEVSRGQRELVRRGEDVKTGQKIREEMKAAGFRTDDLDAEQLASVERRMTEPKPVPDRGPGPGGGGGLEDLLGARAKGQNPWDPPAGFEDSLRGHGYDLQDIDNPLKRGDSNVPRTSDIPNAAELTKFHADLVKLRNTDPDLFNEALKFGGLDNVDQIFQQDFLGQRQIIDDIRSFLKDRRPQDDLFSGGGGGVQRDLDALMGNSDVLARKDEILQRLYGLEQTDNELFSRLASEIPDNVEELSRDELAEILTRIEKEITTKDLFSGRGQISIFRPNDPGETENMLRQRLFENPLVPEERRMFDYGPSGDSLFGREYAGNEFGAADLNSSRSDKFKMLPFGGREEGGSDFFRFDNQVLSHNALINQDIQRLAGGDTNVFMRKSGSPHPDELKGWDGIWDKPTAEANPFKSLFKGKEPEDPGPLKWDSENAIQPMLEGDGEYINPFDVVRLSDQQFNSLRATQDVLRDLGEDVRNKLYTRAEAEPVFRRGVFNLMEMPDTEFSRDASMRVYNNHFGPTWEEMWAAQQAEPQQQALPWDFFLGGRALGDAQTKQRELAEEALKAALQMAPGTPGRSHLMKFSTGMVK